MPKHRIAKWQLLLFAVLLSALFGTVTRAQTTYNAASCSLANVQSAYATEQAKKADGDIINIPSCGSTAWSSSWSISPTNSLTIQGQSTTTGTCAPGGTCAATDNTNIALSATLTFTTASGKSFRLTGMSFTVTGSARYGATNFLGSSTAVRVDHNHFTDDVSGDHTLQVQEIRGVFDHNYFQTPLGENINFFQVANYGSDGLADAVWAQPENFGTSDLVYIENNFFTGSFVYDCDYGGKIAFRYNISSFGTQIQTHGTGSGGRIRGCRATETYGNAFTYSASNNTTFFAVVDYEGGPSMWWGNTVSGYDRLLREQEVRASTITYTQNIPPAGWGYCGTTQTGTASNWDRNSNSTGYACLDQVGRGAGDLLQGGFTSDESGSNNACDTATTKCTSGINTGSWPNQALIPTYAWTNTFNADGDSQFYWQSLNSFDPVNENRDYYLQLPNVNESATFNGTAGIGTGSSLPSTTFPTCTPNSSSDAIASGTTWLGVSVSGHWGPGYWDSTDNKLYICTAANTWTAYYAPYTYPHPLTLGSVAGTPTPAAPTNLTAVVQ